MQKIKKHVHQSGALKHFTIRGDGSSRLEALSDGVFALAIAILLLSSSVPSNFQELWLFVIDIVPFGICMLFIYWIWRMQVTFFLRYGLLNDTVSALNLLLLFLVLFYVYPLKFLMSWLIKYFTAVFTGNFRNEIEEFATIIPFQKIPVLMIIYSTGFVCILLVMYLLYRHAYKKRGELGLSEIEIYETRFSIKDKLSAIMIGLLSIALAVASIVFRNALGSILAGFIYNLIWMISIFQERKRSRDLKRLQQAPPTTSSPSEHPA